MAFPCIGHGHEGLVTIVYNLTVKTVFAAATHFYYKNLFPVGFFQGEELLIVLICLLKKKLYLVSAFVQDIQLPDINHRKKMKC